MEYNTPVIEQNKNVYFIELEIFRTQYNNLQSEKQNHLEHTGKYTWKKIKHRKRDRHVDKQRRGIGNDK